MSVRCMLCYVMFKLCNHDLRLVLIDRNPGFFKYLDSGGCGVWAVVIVQTNIALLIVLHNGPVGAHGSIL